MGESNKQVAPARELIESNHQFPGEYMIKAFGPAHEPFRVAVGEAVFGAVGARVETSERIKGNTICITLVLAADSVDEVIATYERLHAVPGLRMIL